MEPWRCFGKNLNEPTNLREKNFTYDKLVEELKAHYGQKIAELVARTKLSSVKQKQQSVEEYAAALRESSVYCHFGINLDVRLIRDEFVNALHSESISKSLMENDRLALLRRGNELLN